MQTQEEEQIIWRGSPSQIVNVFPIIFGILAFIALLVVIMYAWEQFGLANYQYATSIASLVLVLPLLYILQKWLAVKYEIHEVTNKRIKIRKSIVNSGMRPAEMFRVKDVEPDIPWYLGMFGLGTVVIYTSDMSDPVIKIRAIKGAQELNDTIEKIAIMERRAQGVTEIDYDRVRA